MKSQKNKILLKLSIIAGFILATLILPTRLTGNSISEVTNVSFNYTLGIILIIFLSAILMRSKIKKTFKAFFK